MEATYIAKAEDDGIYDLEGFRHGSSDREYLLQAAPLGQENQKIGDRPMRNNPVFFNPPTKFTKTYFPLIIAHLFNQNLENKMRKSNTTQYGEDEDFPSSLFIFSIISVASVV
jgi:hypothetical protein